MPIQDVILIILVFVVTLLFVFLHKKYPDCQKEKMLVIIPVVAVILHLIVCGWNLAMTLTYLSIFFLGLMILFWKKKIGYGICMGLAFILNGTMIAFCLLLPSENVEIVSSNDKVNALQTAIQTMKENYVLSDYKAIDYEEIYQVCLPYFEEAEESDDPVDEYIAWMMFCNQFHDGHVSAIPLFRKDEIMLEACTYLAGNDYGLSMIQLSSGETAAILVEAESEAEQFGIHTGTIIEKWNGEEIEKIRESVNVAYPKCISFPDAENEHLYSSFFIPCGTGEQATVTFINDEGQEETVTLHSIGNYAKRLNEAINLFRYKSDTENLEWNIIDDTHGYLYISQENWSTTDNGSFETVKKKIITMLEYMNDQGVEDIVIDLRNNRGGQDEMGMAILSAFTDESFFYYGDGEEGEQEGEYELVKSYQMTGENHWGEKPIVVLCDNAVSAGDGFIYNSKKLDNVTVMGFTGSVSSFQSTGGYILAGNGLNSIVIYYPILLQLDEDSQIMIDTDENRSSVIRRDVCVPITQESIKSVFEMKEDYELQYALEYLESK